MTFINLKKSIAFYREYAIIDLSNEREVIDMRENLIMNFKESYKRKNCRHKKVQILLYW